MMQIISGFLYYNQKFEEPEGVVKKMTSYDTIRHPVTKTPRFCAVNNISVTQTNKKLTDCSYDCAKSNDCVGFNIKEPEAVCELFETTPSTISLTPGCTYYEVRRDV